MRHIIGVDLGGTNLRAAMVRAEDGVILAEHRVRTEAEAGPDVVIGQILAVIGLARAALPANGELVGIGIGSPGPLDPFAGVVIYMPNLVGWTNIPLRQILESQTGLPVELGNDANAAAVGEWIYGAGRGLHNLVYVTVSTGIGGGVIADGKLVLGRKGSATEVGHHIMDWATRESWEDLAAGPGLARAAARAMAADAGTLLHTMTTVDHVSSTHVALAAAQGDTVAQHLMQREGELIGVGLVNMLFLYSPDLIVVGGGVAMNNPTLLDTARTVIQRDAFEVYRAVPVQLASLGDQVGILGAVALYQHMREGRRA